MSEYIDRQALLDAIPTTEEDKQISLYGAIADFILLVCDVPAADVVPVVHAKWYPLGSAPDLVLCSKCGDWNTYEAKYCLNCGAKMDGR